jgi:phospholipase C
MRTLLAAALAAALLSCDSTMHSWGLDAIATMKTPADGPTDPAQICGVAVPPAAFGLERAACTFKRGDLAEKSLGITPNTVSAVPIRHVVIVMKENRSFDHLLGKLHDTIPEVGAIPANWTNLDPSGAKVSITHATTTCIATDPTHQSVAMRAGIDGGAMDGFVMNGANSAGAAGTADADGHFAMTYYEPTDLPFYNFLAHTFALNDSHFAPMASGTYGNRTFFMFGTNAGVVDTGITYAAPNRTSILHLLMNAGFTWGAYSDFAPFSANLDMSLTDPGVHSMKDFYKALDDGTLPNVSFVDGIDSVDDDHPTADLQKGEAWTKELYDHAIASPQWNLMAILWTYDEGGGFADHVPPPKACQADPTSPFIDMGVRVPFVAISPWAKRNYVSHVVQDHTAMTRFIETIFGLPALSARDANSEALFDLFDFTCGRNLTVPLAPAAGTGGCSK